MAIHKNELTIMDTEDISLSPKPVIYFHKTLKNIDNFTSIKKTTPIGRNLCGYTKKINIIWLTEKEKLQESCIKKFNDEFDVDVIDVLSPKFKV